MKRSIQILAALLLLLSTLSMRKPTISEVLKLEMPGEDGSNSAGIAWHPIQKKYYAVFAGNASFPMAVFNEYGKSISTESFTALQDMRGLWYNPSTKSIEGNGAGENGYLRYVLDANGFPNGFEVIHSKNAQPDFQSAGTFDSKNKRVVFFNGQRVYTYLPKNGSFKKSVKLLLRSEEENYNSTSVISVPSRPNQVGVLNISAKSVEFYSLKKGTFTGSIKLPDSAPVSLFFGFAYANGVYWIFDADNRTWKGYR